MNNDPLANALSAINNADRVNKPLTKVNRSSTIILRVLEVMKAQGYVGELTVEEDGKGGALTVELRQAINKVGAIKPRFAVTADNFVKYEKRYLPASGFGVLIVSTSKGIMTHAEAKTNKIGGKLLAYCY